MSEHKVYVGNLPYTVTNESLQALFDDCGTIDSVNVIEDHYTGKSKGFAFITFEDKSGMDKAVEDKNGEEIDGRKIIVNVAREKEKGGNRGGGGSGGSGGSGGGDRDKKRRRW